MSGNFPRGFHGFQMRIDAITEAMGGDDRLRMCIAHEFDEQIRKSLSAVRKLSLYDKSIHWRTAYTQATTEEFDHASAEMERILSARTASEITAKGSLRGIPFVERGPHIYVEGGGYGLAIASRYRNDHAEKRVGGQRIRREDSWTISISDHAETLRGNMPNKPTRIESHSETSAIKSLRDMVDRHLGVKMVPTKN